MRSLRILAVWALFVIAHAASNAGSVAPVAAGAVYRLDIAAYKAPDWFHGSADTVTLPDGSAAMRVTGGGDPWAAYFVTPPGILQGGHDYTVTVSYEIVDMPAGSYGYAYARADSLGYGADKWARFSGKAGDKGTITLPLSLPDAPDYALTLGMHKKATILVDAMTISAGTGWTHLDASALGRIGGQSRRALPSGSPDFAIDPPAPASQLTLNASDFGLVADGAGTSVTAQQAVKNVAALNAAIGESRAKSAAKLVVAPGVYRLSTTLAIHFANLHDFVFDAAGATFIFDKYHSWHEPAMEVDHCTRCEFDGFTLDWDWDAMPLATIGRVIAKSGDSFDMTFPYLDAAGFEKVQSLPWDDLYQIDAATMSCNGPEYNMSGWGGTTFDPIGDGVLRVHPPHSFPLTVGTTYRIRHAQYDLDGFWLRDDSQIVMRDVSIYSLPGEGWILSGDTDHVALIGCKIALKPGTNRCISTCADGFHVNQSHGYLKLVDCDFGYCGDDCVNIHDNCSQGIRTVDGHTITALSVDRWRTPMAIGDTIEMRRPDLSAVGYASKLTAVSFNGREATLQFADPLPADLPSDTILINRRFWTSNVIIDNCRFHDNRGRGILLAAANVSVTNSTISRTSSQAVYIQTEIADLWSEGFGANNVVFRADAFESVNPAGNYDGCAIVATPQVPAGTASYPIFQDMLFEDNKFDDVPGEPIELVGAKDIWITGNTFSNRAALPAPNPQRGVIAAEGVTGLTVSGNIWRGTTGRSNSGVRYDTNPFTQGR